MEVDMIPLNLSQARSRILKSAQFVNYIGMPLDKFLLFIYYTCSEEFVQIETRKLPLKLL